MTAVAYRPLIRNPNKQRQVAIAIICLFVALLIGGLWRHWVGPHYMLNAVGRGDVSKAKLLAHLQVDPNADVFLIGGLMHCAAAAGQTQIMEILQHAGADLNRIDGNGATPAHVAVKFGQLNSLQWLIGHGADTSRTNRHGLTVAQSVTNDVPEPKQEEFLSVIRNGRGAIQKR